MRGLLYLALGVSIMVFVASSFLVWVNYKEKKKDMENYVTNLERDLFRRESD